MALRENELIVPPGHTSVKKAGKGWLETLHRWLVHCPQCSQVRLVVGAQENDRYVCKDCGHSFAIKL
jgi:ribosomal protein S27AE